MKLIRPGSQASVEGPAEHFTGTVRIVEIRAGDVVWCPPGHKHWHGATATTAMAHIAIQEAADGKNVAWLKPVTDAQYLSGQAAPSA